MDKKEAQEILSAEIAKYKQRSFAELRALIGDVDAYAINSPSGVEYQIEIQVHWDGVEGGDLRIIAGIDDGRFFSALSPLTDSFIIAPNGELFD